MLLNGDIMAETNCNGLEINVLFDIKAVPFKYYTPRISAVDCCASLPQNRRGDSFSVRCMSDNIKLWSIGNHNQGPS